MRMVQVWVYQNRRLLLLLCLEEQIAFFINLLIFIEDERIVRARQVSDLEVKQQLALAL